MIEAKAATSWQTTLAPVIAHLKASAHIRSLFVSVAAGDDDASVDDIALRVIVAAESDMNDVLDLWRVQIETIAPIAFGFEVVYHENDYLVLLRLENETTLHATFIRAEHMQIDGQGWTVVFDHAGLVEDRDQVSEPFSDAEAAYLRLSHRMWQQLMYIVIALRHDQLWRAVYELEQIRHAVVDLACVRNDLSKDGYRDVHQLPEMFQIRLRQTLPSSFSSSAIKRAVRAGVGYFYGEAAALDGKITDKVIDDLENQMKLFMDSYL